LEVGWVRLAINALLVKRGWEGGIDEGFGELVHSASLSIL